MLLHLRNMHEADLDAVYAIEQNVQKTPWSRDILRDCVAVGYDCRVLELIIGEKHGIIGYIISRYTFNTCHVLNLCIAKDMQHRGFGTIMVNSLLRSMAKPDIKLVILEVRPSNNIAMQLYEKLGFEQSEIRKNYYQDLHGSEDALVYRKKII